MKKAVFFDIDGTLWDEQRYIPPQTINAIHMLRQNGHYAFICSGRSRGSIQAKELLDIGFDGVLAGCGTHVEYQGKVIYEHLLTNAQLEEILAVLEKDRQLIILEGPDSLFVDFGLFGEDAYVQRLHDALGNNLKDMSEFTPESRLNKLSATCKRESLPEIVRALQPHYELIFHNEVVVEILPKGFSKAEGIRRICEYLDVSVEDTFAFGDGANDMEMLQFVDTGIAMGNATKAAKQAADYVTASVTDDGIYKALEHFGLV